MLIKLIYILLFALSNFVIYSLVNKTGWVHRSFLITFTVIFILVFIFNTGLFNSQLTLPKKHFFLLTFVLAFPFLTYLWFNFLALKRIDRLKDKGVNEEFVNRATKVFSFFFLKVTFIMAFIVQCSLILNVYS